MQEQQRNGIRYLTFAGLSALAGVHHGIFTRHGGVSQGAFASLNVGRVDGEAPEHVVENRHRVAAALGGGPLVGVRQVHGNTVKVVTAEDVTAAPTPADALVTNVPGVLLMVQVADCQPVLLCDPVRKAVAAVHSGWRGSVANVVAVAVRALQDCYGTRPRDLVAGIGPSLGPCCGQFVHYRDEIPERLWPFRVGAHHFDFWAITRAQLSAAGLAPQRIETAGICTRCRTDTFYSYRAEGTTGRFAAVIGLAPDGDPAAPGGPGRTV